MRRILSLVTLLLLFVTVFSTPVLADSHIPIGLQKIIDYNNQSTADFAVKISFLV